MTIGNKRIGRPPAQGFTKREADVVLLILKGLSKKEVAKELGLKVSSLRNYYQTIYSKADVHSQIELILKFKDVGRVA